MRPESTFIPFEARKLPGERVLVLAPHPDDEIFGCGGALTLKAAEGAEIQIVIVTDGAAQGEAATRRKESIAACRALGLPRPEFWGLADRSLGPEMPELVEKLHEVLLAFEPQLLLIPSPAEIHPDHRALSLAVALLLKRSPPLDALTVACQRCVIAAYEVSSMLHPNLLVDVTEVWPGVLEASRCFGSQLEAAPYLEVLDALSITRRLTLGPDVRHAEAYFAVEHAWLRTHSIRDWAAWQGPIAGLEIDGGTAIDVVSFSAPDEVA